MTLNATEKSNKRVTRFSISKVFSYLCLIQIIPMEDCFQSFFKFFKFRIAGYKLAIASYNVRIVGYKF